MILKFRAYITYGYTSQELNDPGLFEEIQETGLGFIDAPDLIDFENQKIKYDSEWYDKDRFKLMQSTGMIDKNGKEVFESDIIKPLGFASWIGVVEYSKENAAYILNDHDNEFLRSEVVYLSQFNDGLEILGNIYENPELLEESE